LISRVVVPAPNSLDGRDQGSDVDLSRVYPFSLRTARTSTTLLPASGGTARNPLLRAGDVADLMGLHVSRTFRWYPSAASWQDQPVRDRGEPQELQRAALVTVHERPRRRVAREGTGAEATGRVVRTAQLVPPPVTHSDLELRLDRAVDDIVVTRAARRSPPGRRGTTS